MAYGLFGWNGAWKQNETRAVYHRNHFIYCFELRSFFFLFCEIWLLLSMANGERLMIWIGKSSGDWPISSGWITFITMIYDLTLYSSENFIVLLIISSKM